MFINLIITLCIFYSYFVVLSTVGIFIYYKKCVIIHPIIREFWIINNKIRFISSPPIDLEIKWGSTSWEITGHTNEFNMLLLAKFYFKYKILINKEYYVNNKTYSEKDMLKIIKLNIFS